MLVYLNTSGSHGDVHPFLAIGRALTRRGHEVVLFCHPHFTEDVKAAGLAHVPLSPELDYEAVVRDPRLMHPRKGGRFLMNLMTDMAPGAIETVRRQVETRPPDVFAAHHVCIGSRWICERAGVPLAIAQLAPLFWFSPSDPVPAPQRTTGRLDALRAHAMMTVGKPLLSWYADRWISKLRRGAGFPPDRGGFLRDMYGGDVNLGLWSPHFRAPTPDDPPHTRTCGFPWYDRAETGAGLDAELSAFLDDGPPPIVFALGSAAVYTAGDYYEIAAEACTRLGRRGVLLTGTPEFAPSRLPDGVRAFGYAPFSLVFLRGCASVHHGGIGSTAQGLRAGRPTVLVPHAHDQFNNAVRVAKLGVGGFVHRHRLTVDRMSESLRSVLDDPGINGRCAEMATALAREDGAGKAADAIEALG